MDIYCPLPARTVPVVDIICPLPTRTITGSGHNMFTAHQVYNDDMLICQIVWHTNWTQCFRFHNGFSLSFSTFSEISELLVTVEFSKAWINTKCHTAHIALYTWTFAVLFGAAHATSAEFLNLFREMNSSTIQSNFIRHTFLLAVSTVSPWLKKMYVHAGMSSSRAVVSDQPSENSCTKLKLSHRMIGMNAVVQSMRIYQRCIQYEVKNSQPPPAWTPADTVQFSLLVKPINSTHTFRVLRHWTVHLLCRAIFLSSNHLSRAHSRRYLAAKVTIMNAGNWKGGAHGVWTTSSEFEGQRQTAERFSIKLLVKLCHQSC